MKKLFFVLALSACAFNAFAQTEPVVTETSNDKERVVTTVEYSKNVMTNDFKYNWEIMAALGSQFYYGDNDKYFSFFERFTFPTVDVMLTKWASPVFGFAFGLDATAFKGLYQRVGGVADELGAHFQTNTFVKSAGYTRGSLPVDYYLQKGFYWNPFVAATFDLCNLFGGYKGDRFYNLQAYAGGGLVIGNDKPTDAHGVSFNLGLINKFRLGEHFDLVINLRGAFVSDDFDGESRFQESTVAQVKKNVPWDGEAGITAGLCYHFGVKKNLHNWTKAANTTVEHFYAPVTVPGPERIVKETVEVIRPVDPSLWFHINFRKDKTDILPRERININSIADFIKSTPDTKFIVCGFADKQTSYPEHNLWLSEHRAKNVYDMLVNQFGVNPEQLVVDYKGGVDYMFYSNEDLSRCVMIVPLDNNKGIEEYGEREIKK